MNQSDSTDSSSIPASLMVFPSLARESKEHRFFPLFQDRHCKQNAPFFSVHHFPSSNNNPLVECSISPSTVPSELNFIDVGWLPLPDSVSTVAPVRSFAISSEDKGSAEAVAERRAQSHTEQRKRKRVLIFTSRSSRRCRTGPPVAMTFITIGVWNQLTLVLRRRRGFASGPARRAEAVVARGRRGRARNQQRLCHLASPFYDVPGCPPPSPIRVNGAQKIGWA